MKRFLLILGVLLLLPATASADVIWWNEAPLPYDRPLTFVDTVAPTVREDRLEAWRAIRTRALDNWQVPHAVQEDWSGTLPVVDDSHGEEIAVPGVIRVARDQGEVCESYGGYMDTVGGGVAVICLYPLWWKSHNLKAMAGQLGHEVGHAFGLGHSSTGIMSGGLVPSAEEVLAVTEMYR